MLTKGKYEVYHRPSGSSGSGWIDEETFFVLRAGDALASMTLRSYVANALQVLDWGIDPTTGQPLTEDQKEQLSTRIDGASRLADQWAEGPHKIPD